MKVLVAVDHKPSSQAIIDALIKMHWYEGTEIHVITVRSDGSEVSTLEEIEDLAVELHKSLPMCQVFFLSLNGDPKTAIIEMSRQIQADMIVLGSNCKNTVERLLLGSVCQAVVDGSQCPVIVAKTPCCLAREVSPGFRNILIPIDNSIFSDVAVRWLANFDWGKECRFIVAAAVDENANMNQVRQSLQKRANNLSKILGTKNVAVEVAVGEPRQCIIELASKHYTDLIVIGSHGRTGLKKLILGNIAQSVSHEAPCAVAIVRGIAPNDEQWVDSGAYEKVEPIPIEALIAASRRERAGELSPPNVMPGGM